MLRIEQRELAEKAGVSLETIKRIEKSPGQISALAATRDAIQRALEAAGVEFTNGAQPGVRMRGEAAAALDAAINDAQERSEAEIPAGPSPASGLGQFRRGLAENDLRTLKEKRRRGRPPQKGGNDNDPNPPR